MKILLLSDTHGYLDDAIKRHANEADEIWHAGDFGTIALADELQKIKPLRGVYGNIDGKDVRLSYPLDNTFQMDGIKVFMTHIGGYPGRYEPRLKPIISQHPPHLFICGHSHLLKVIRDPKNNMLCMNPGAAGIHGFHKVRTMLRFVICDGKINNLEAIELGLRGKMHQ
ncbi:MAG TPA: metallophosphoesterase family protein [Chitinophagales bacterium]|nr:metallophosphoesterase family protein [Chitinophagales bacterium]HRG27956.1 metallophosphoesterase family protein [Chitinophagales bacterium]HRG85412.1 metallophosphoesterase family protein [Chitinophagales bacterium]HRH51710.1 metallophosphoesterase family protein [Chitinophagales bacterium]